LLLPLLPAFFLLGRPRMSRLPSWLRRAALGTRLLIVTLIVLALSQPLLGHTSDAVSVVFAVDRSESVSQEARQNATNFINQTLQQVSETRRAGVVAFGREAQVERPIGGVIGVGATVETDATLKLWLDTKLISEQPVHLTPGSNRFTASQASLKKGFHTFWARVEGPVDTFKENNELSGFTVVKDKPR